MQSSTTKKLVAVSLALAVIIAVPAIIYATKRPKPVDRDTALAFTLMRGDLRGLIMSELGTKRITGKYTADPDLAGHLSSFGVDRPVIQLVDTGWTAVVTHKGIPGIRCAIGWHARNPLKTFAKSGEIICE